MKKTRLFALLAAAILLAALLAGCGGAEKPASEPESSEESGPVYTGMEKVIRDLMTKNVDVFKNILGSGNLGYTGDPVQGAYIYKVSSLRFSRYSALVAYLNSIYTEQKVEELLNPDGQPVYLDVSGTLCVDITKVGSKGYYVDWDNYTVEITEQTDTTCKFTLHTKSEIPAPTPTFEDYTVDGSLTLVDTLWRLTDMIG